MGSPIIQPILSPAGWADYYGNEAFYLNYPDDERKAWNYMTEWNTKSGHVTYKESGDKLPAISKYYNYDNGAPVVASLPTVSPASIVMPKSC